MEWKLFQNRFVHTKFDIYVFIKKTYIFFEAQSNFWPDVIAFQKGSSQYLCWTSCTNVGVYTYDIFYITKNKYILDAGHELDFIVVNSTLCSAIVGRTNV